MTKDNISPIVAKKWLKAKVIKGDSRGKELGFPTINLKMPTTCASWRAGIHLPPAPVGGQEFTKYGVYFCHLKIIDNNSNPGVRNNRNNIFPGLKKGLLFYGKRLTFNEIKPSLEIHILNFNKKIKPGTEIKFKLLKYLRKVKKFKDKNSLINQIREDIKKVKRFIKLKWWILVGG